jgi:hypothetical protein
MCSETMCLSLSTTPGTWWLIFSMTTFFRWDHACPLRRRPQECRGGPGHQHRQHAKAYFVPETLNVEQAEVVWFRSLVLVTPSTGSRLRTSRDYSLVIKVSTSFIFLGPISSCTESVRAFSTAGLAFASSSEQQDHSEEDRYKRNVHNSASVYYR